MAHSNACARGRWLGGSMVVGLVSCGDGIGWLRWWCLVKVKCSGHGGLGERRLRFCFGEQEQKGDIEKIGGS